MIRRVWFREFRALRCVDVPLERLTVLVGANSVGKTSVLEGTRVLLDGIRTEPLTLFQARWPMDRARMAPAGDPTVLGIETDSGGLASVHIRPGDPQSGGPAVVPTLQLRVGGQDAEVQHPFNAHVQRIGEPCRSFMAELPIARHLRMEAHRLTAPSYFDAEIPSLGVDGTGLASVIDDLKGRTPEVIDALLVQVRKVVPQVRRIRAIRAQIEQTEWDVVTVNDQRVRTSRTQRYWGHRVVVDMQSGSDIALSEAGDGTALVVGLMTTQQIR